MTDFGPLEAQAFQHHDHDSAVRKAQRRGGQVLWGVVCLGAGFGGVWCVWGFNPILLISSVR